MEKLLALEMVRVTEAAAIASARVMGRGDRMGADKLATEAMRVAMDEIEMQGTIVIGEGERDEAPMLYIGEQVGLASADAPAIDIAVDPLEGTNLVATGSANAITVLAASESGGLVHAPDTYLEKLCVGPGAAGKVDITLPPAENVRLIAAALGRKTGDITVIILDRPRHADLIAEVRGTGARIKLISDGDLSAAISCAVQGTGVHAVMGIGGAPEGVITAAAHALPRWRDPGPVPVSQRRASGRAASGWATATRAGSTEPRTSRRARTSCSRRRASRPGDLLEGVRFFGGGARTHSLVMAYQTKTVRFVDTVHMFDRERPPSVRL